MKKSKYTELQQEHFVRTKKLEGVKDQIKELGGFLFVWILCGLSTPIYFSLTGYFDQYQYPLSVKISYFFFSTILGPFNWFFLLPEGVEYL